MSLPGRMLGVWGWTLIRDFGVTFEFVVAAAVLGKMLAGLDTIRVVPSTSGKKLILLRMKFGIPKLIIHFFTQVELSKLGVVATFNG